jgi:hypothetical protein
VEISLEYVRWTITQNLTTKRRGKAGLPPTIRSKNIQKTSACVKSPDRIPELAREKSFELLATMPVRVLIYPPLLA